MPYEMSGAVALRRHWAMMSRIGVGVAVMLLAVLGGPEASARLICDDIAEGPVLCGCECYLYQPYYGCVYTYQVRCRDASGEEIWGMRCRSRTCRGSIAKHTPIELQAPPSAKDGCSLEDPKTSSERAARLTSSELMSSVTLDAPAIAVRRR